MVKGVRRSYRQDVELATVDLTTMHHVSIATGLDSSEVSGLLPKGREAPVKFVDRVKYLFGVYKSKAVAADSLSADRARDHDSAYQNLRKTRLQAEKLEHELKVKQGQYVALDDIQRDLAQVSQVAAKNLDGLLPKIQSLVPNLPAHVSDQIEDVIAKCRNGIAGVELRNENEDGD